MPVLKILLLGPSEIWWNENILTISRRLPRAILFYLAAGRNMVSRNEILSLLWEHNTPVSKARLRLNENLSRLRKILPSPEIVITENNLIGLDRDQFMTDLHTFEDLISKAGQTPWQIPKNEPLPGYTAEVLHQAVALWRGNQFLSGNALPSTPAFDSWLTRTASHLQRLRGNTLERLAEHTFVIGNLESALQYARLALENDEFNGNLHNLVMECFIEQGNLNEAKEFFEQIRDFLDRELNILPSEDLISTYNRIQFIREDEKKQPLLKWDLHPSMKVPFVGRKEIMLKMRRDINQGKSLFILGEAGQGKTRLAQEFISKMHPKPRIMVIPCQLMDSVMPFQPICSALREGISPEEWRSLPRVWVSQLTYLLPELCTIYGDLDTPSIPGDPVHAQAAILEAIRQLFISLSRDQSLFLVLDDAHWADEATLATITYLHSRVPFVGNNHLIVLARQEEKTSSFETFLNNLDQTQYSEIIFLSRLEPEDISALTQFILKKTPPQKFVSNIMKGTGGNSLFVLETLRSILERNPDHDLWDGSDIPLPKSILNLIQSRISQLTTKTRTILENVAVIGSEFNLNLLIGLTQQTISATAHPMLVKTGIVSAIEELEQRLILHAVPDTTGIYRYRFNHEKFREALLSNMSPAKAMFIHSNMADFLAKNYQTQQPAILAYHHQAAGKLPEAYNYWVDAGHHARELFAVADANRLYSQAEALIQEVGEILSDDEIYGLYAPWSELAYETHNTLQVRKLGKDLKSLGLKRKSPLLIGTALDTLSDACMTENKFKEGLDFATRALPYLEKSKNTFVYMEANIHRGVFLYMLNQLDDAILAFQDALALATETATPEMIRARSNAHYQISLLRTMAGWPEQGRQHAVLSLEDANLTNRTYLQVSAYFVLAISHYFLGEYHKAREYAYTGIDLAKRSKALRMLGYLQGYAAATDAILGNLDSALSLATKTLQIGEEYELNDVIALGCRHLADIYALLRVPEKAIHYFQRGALEASGHFLGLDNLIRLGYFQTISGQKELGHQNLSFSLTASQNINIGMGVILTEYFQSLAYIAEGNWKMAKQLANKVQGEAAEHAMPFEHLSATKSLAIIELNTGDPDTAVEQLYYVAQGSKAIGEIWLEMETLLVLEKVLNKQGDRDLKIRERLDQIMAHIIANTKHESLRKYLHKLIQNID
jgi:DNA-binding SARP family transcriptional activator